MTLTVGQSLSRWLREDFHPARLLPALTSGALIGITEVIVAISLGSLIFSGELASFLPYGTGMALITAAIIMMVTALTSSAPGVMGSTQDTTSVILAVIAAALIGALSAAGPQEKLATVLVVISITNLLTGVFLLALGWFKLG